MNYACEFLDWGSSSTDGVVCCIWSRLLEIAFYFYFLTKGHFPVLSQRLLAIFQFFETQCPALLSPFSTASGCSPPLSPTTSPTTHTLACTHTHTPYNVDVKGECVFYHTGHWGYWVIINSRIAHTLRTLTHSLAHMLAHTHAFSHTK